MVPTTNLGPKISRRWTYTFGWPQKHLLKSFLQIDMKCLSQWVCCTLEIHPNKNTLSWYKCTKSTLGTKKKSEMHSFVPNLRSLCDTFFKVSRVCGQVFSVIADQVCRQRVRKTNLIVSKQTISLTLYVYCTYDFNRFQEFVSFFYYFSKT